MQHDLKKFVKDLLSFLGVATTSYLVLVCVWGDLMPDVLLKNLKYNPAGPGHFYTRINDVKKINNLELLILGSSHAYRGFDTREFKQAGFKNVFNLGSSAQTPMQTEVLLERYLDELQPEVIVYEVFPKIFCIDVVESSVDLISNDENDVKSLEMTAEIGSIKTFNTLVYASYRDMFGLDADVVEKIEEGRDKYIQGGYVESDLAYNDVENFPKAQWTFNEDQFNAFEQIVEMIEEKNIKLVLVNAPITKTLYNSYANNKEFDKRMEKYGEYYNFNEIMTVHDSLDFQDDDHLNQNGVEKFNEKLLSMRILQNKKPDKISGSNAEAIE